MTEPVVTLRDVKSVMQCRRGAKLWIDRYGLDWHQFRTVGLPVSVIEATGDALARKVLEKVRGRK